MPELPEVEVVRVGLERYLPGRTVSTVEVLHPRAVRRHVAGPVDFTDGLRGVTITGARRRGKYLWLPVAPAAGTRGPLAGAQGPLAGARGRPAGWPAAPEPALALLAHLGMSGQLLLGDPGRPLAAHVRVRLTFTDAGPDLRFTDQRTFGHLALVDARAGVPGLISHIAPDPLEPAFDEAAVTARLRSRSSAVKTALLDQSLVSGIGNIYADEALWRARLHWARPACTLRRAEAARLLAAVREVLREALSAGGTSFDRLYVNVDGQGGYFGRALAAYGREGEPCPRCGAPIRREPFANRSSYSCPACQPRPRARRGTAAGRRPGGPVAAR